MRSSRLLAWIIAVAAALPSHAAEHVLLRSGFSVDCVRHETQGDRLRLILGPGAGANYMEIATASIASIEQLPDNLSSPATTPPNQLLPQQPSADSLSGADMQSLLLASGTRHRVDADLLASVVRAESGGHTHAVSRTGARGLMQLMPGTATELGVHDAFQPADNIEGGSAYLDRLLLRYHDNIVLALAAYNAGPAAVDRWHGVPPFHETRAYVARVIREFNRRKLAPDLTARAAVAGSSRNLSSRDTAMASGELRAEAASGKGQR